jgi:hypothetical protein
MVKNVFYLMLSLVLIMAGIMMVVTGVQGSNGAVPQYQEVKVTTVASPTATAVVSTVASPVATVKITATAEPSGKASAEVAGYGTDKDTYNRGDKASGYIMLKNTGDVAIKDATVKVTVSRDVPALGTTTIGSKDFKVSGLNVNPGETKKAEFSVDIPKEYSGFSTAGDYQLNGKILVGGKEVGDFSKSIKVV